MNILEAITSSGLAISRSEARRYISQKSVKVNGILIDNLISEIKAGDEIQIGKRIKRLESDTTADRRMESKLI